MVWKRICRKVPGTSRDAGRRAALAAACFLALGVAIPHADAGRIFVRADGSRGCDGRADRPGERKPCAFDTIGRAVRAARCGDTIEIGPGTFGEPKLVITASCPEERPLVIEGSGRAATFWMAGLAEIEAASCRRAGDGSWSCALPEGSRPEATGADCLVQRQASKVRFFDENGTHGDMAGPVCLTWAGPGADLPEGEGVAGAVGDRVRLRPWNGLEPERAGLWYPREARYQSGADGAVRIDGDGIQLRNLSLVSGANHALAVLGDRVLLGTVDVYTGRIWIDRTSRGATLEHVTIRNNYRRPPGDTAADAWGRMRSQSLSILGDGFTLSDVETYASREGIGVSGGADGRIDGLFAHGHHNHALKFTDGAGPVVARNVLIHDSQEPLFIECAHDLTFEHATFPFGAVVVQENPKKDCQPRVSNLDFRDSILCGISFFDRYGDTWAGGGHDLERNLYLTDGDLCRRGSAIVKAAGHKFRDLAAWQNFADDPCRDCTRDRGSRAESGRGTFASFAWRDDTFATAFDFDLRPGSAAIDLGPPASAAGHDIEGVLRTGREDAGAYEGGPTAWLGRDAALRLLVEPLEPIVQPEGRGKANGVRAPE